MISTASSAAAVYLISACSLGAAAGWALRLLMPAQASRNKLLDLPTPVSVRRRVQSGRRAWGLFFFAMAVGAAVLGLVYGTEILLDPLAVYVLSAGFLLGLFLVRFPLSAGLPLLAGLSALTISLMVQSGPLSPLHQELDALEIRVLRLSPENQELQVMDLQVMELQLQFSTAGQDRRENLELEGNAYRVLWHEYRISAWYLPLRNHAMVPGMLISGSIPHQDPGDFSTSEEYVMAEAARFPPWIRVEVSEYYEQPVVARLQRTVRHNPPLN